MGTDASWPLQQAILDRLKSSKAICTHLGMPPAILDQGEAGEGYPFLRLGASRAKAWHSATFDGQEHEIIMHLWNRDGGSNRSKEMAAALVDELHDADFPVPGHALVDLQFDSSETRFSEPEAAYHCQLTFKGLTVSD